MIDRETYTEHIGEVVLGRTAGGEAVLGVPQVARVRLMRGQVVVREEAPSSVLWTPELGPRQVKTHRGVVLGLGPPARLTEHPDSPEVPHGFKLGDLVQYHFGAVGTQEARTRAWTDGKPATWLCQPEIDAVWEASECGAVCPDGPYAGVVCELDSGHAGEHEAYAEQEFLESWS